MNRVLHTGRLLSALVAIAVSREAAAARAQQPTAPPPPHAAVDFRISCSAPAQVEFNRAVTLLHHMTYPQARNSFQEVARIDPRCAMAYWGIGMTLFQPLWPTRPGPAELRSGWEAVQKARTLGPVTERERLFLDADSAFFAEPASPDYWARIRRWEQAMARAYAAFPNDAEVTVFYALAHLAVAPVDTATQTHAERAAELLLGVLQRNPDHPGAQHYLVHADDAPGRERQSLDVVRQYETSAPNNPHALHMPTHIYVRLGDWDAVIRGNRRAADAALKYPAGDHGEFVWDEFPHAMEYLIYALLQQGADAEAARELQRLQGTARLQPSFKTAFHLASTRARYALERHDWREAMSLPVREPATLDWDRFAWAEAVTWFARGLGAAHESHLDDTRVAIARLQALEGLAGGAGEELFARNIRMLRLETSAWLAHVERDTQTSVSLMQQAAELERNTPKHAVTPSPTLPGYELLGDLLLEQKRPAEALAAYQRSLRLYPRRFNSLLGAARAARAAGNESEAYPLYRQLASVAASGTRQPALEEVRVFISLTERPGPFEPRTIARNLETPWSLAFAPDGRLFVAERPGRIRIIRRDSLMAEPWAVIPVHESAASSLETGLMGLALDPEFARNHRVYVCYTQAATDGALTNRISVLTEARGRGMNLTVLVDRIPAGSYHDGCRLKFGPDGKLYATTGDATGTPSEAGAAQLTSSLAGKILRLNPDGSVPRDNPFPGSYVWSYGHRNPQGLAFEPGTGRLIATEHGTGGDGNNELNVIERGRNYGWPTVIGAAQDPRFTPPIYVGEDAPTGATFVTSTRYPGLRGSLLVTTLSSRRLLQFVFRTGGSTAVAERRALIENTYGRLRDVIEGPDGFLYLATSNRDGRGQPAAEDDRVIRLLPHH